MSDRNQREKPLFGFAFISTLNDQIFVDELGENFSSLKANFLFGDGFTPSVGDSFTFLRLGDQTDLDIQFAIAGLGDDARRGLDFRIGNERGADINNYVLEVFAAPDVGPPAPIPLPAGAWLTLSALGVLGVVARRRHPSSKASSSA